MVVARKGFVKAQKVVLVRFGIDYIIYGFGSYGEHSLAGQPLH